MKELISYLSAFVTKERLLLFDKIIEQRTRYITIVLEDIYQPQNASAVLRTCDCFGIQDIHIIENRNEFSPNPNVELGASKWLTLNKYNKEEENSLKSIKQLKQKGYRIVATTPHKDDTLLDQLDLSEKTAIIFGTELEGLSETAISNADAFVKIPRYGFTESFNISVSAAIVLHHLTEKLRASDIPWQMSEDDILGTRLSWAKSVVKHPDKHEAAFRKSIGAE